MKRFWRQGPWFPMAVLSAVIAFALAWTPPVRQLEWELYDARFLWRGERAPVAPVVILALDNNVKINWWEPSPFWPLRLAEVIQRADAAGAAVIAVDHIFPADTDRFLEERYGQIENTPNLTFALAVAEAGDKVVLARSLPSKWPPDQLPPEFEVMMEGRSGFVEIPIDEDGMRRRGYAQSRLKGAPPETPKEPSFSAAIARKYSRDVALPNELFFVNFTGGGVPVISLAELLEKPEGFAQLKGKIVLIGATFNGSGDVHPTPFSNVTDGVAMQADMVDTLLSQNYIQVSSPATNGLLAAAVSLLVFAAGYSWRPVWAALLMLGVCVALLAASFPLFAAANFSLGVATTCTAAILAYGIAFGTRFLAEENRRREIQTEFGVQISPSLLDYLLENPHLQSTSGIEAEATIMFLDLRGSTQFAEGKEPHVVVDALNSALSPAVQAVHDHGGYVGTFMGDGFLAVFGAPQPLSDHKERATRAAIAIREALAEGQWGVAISLHAGTICCGYIGNEQRRSFSVFGDPVNAAARLNETAKAWNATILCSEEAAPDWVLRSGQKAPEPVILRSKSKPVYLYFV